MLTSQGREECVTKRHLTCGFNNHSLYKRGVISRLGDRCGIVIIALARLRCLDAKVAPALIPHLVLGN